MEQKKDNVIRFRKQRRFNIGVVLFLLIVIYLVWSLVSYAVRGKEPVFEVSERSALASVDSFTGLVLRQEEVVRSGWNGYFNGYVSSGQRIRVGNTVCSVDETGEYNRTLHSEEGMAFPESAESTSALLSAMEEYRQQKQADGITAVYRLRSEIDSLTAGARGSTVREEAAALGIPESMFHILSADQSGLVLYETDGYEGKDVTSLTAGDLDPSAYQSRPIISGELVGANDPLYKAVTSEDWIVVIPMDSGQISRYAEHKQCRAEFPEAGLTLTAGFSMAQLSDETVCGVLSLNRSLSSFLDSRFTSVILSEGGEEGLLIPSSALCTREFMAVPAEYAARGANSTELQFQKVLYDDPGAGIELISPRIVAKTEEYYYVDPSEMPAGTTLLKPDSQDRYTLGTTETLSGVYCVNRGYCTFRTAEVITQRDGWAAVRESSAYGITMYDRILEDASRGEEGRVIY